MERDTLPPPLVPAAGSNSLGTLSYELTTSISPAAILFLCHIWTALAVHAIKRERCCHAVCFLRVSPFRALQSHLIFLFSPHSKKLQVTCFAWTYTHTHAVRQNIKRHWAVSKPTSASVTERVWCCGSAPLCVANDVARACRVGVERIWKWNCDIHCDNFTATQFPAGRRDLPGSLKWLFVFRATSSRPAIYFFFFGGFRPRLTGVPLRWQTPVSRQQTPWEETNTWFAQCLQTGWYTTSEEKWKPRDPDSLEWRHAGFSCQNEGGSDGGCTCCHQCVWSTHTSSFRVVKTRITV